MLRINIQANTSKFVTCIKFKESSYDQKSVLRINTITSISIDESTLIILKMSMFSLSL